MIEYLLQILENNNRVILPEFGAFIIKNREPLTIVFNEFLQYNDGQIIDAILKQENIDRESAKIKLDEFIRNLNDTLNKGNDFPLGQLGTLTKNAAGRISLEEPGTPEQPKSKKEKTDIYIKPEREIKIETPPPPPPPPVKPVKPEVAKAEKPVGVSSQKTQTPKKPEIPAEQPAQKTEPIIKPQAAKEYVPPTTYSTAKEHEITSQTSPESGRRIRVIVWIIIILIVNGLIIAYFLTSENLDNYFMNRDNKTTPTELPQTKKEPVTSKSATSHANSPEVMATLEDSIKKTVQEKSIITKHSSSTKKFYIVAGVFSSEQNAKKMVRELKNKGYHSENFDKIGSMYAVSYDVFTTREAAEKELAKIKRDYDSKAWIKVKD